MSNHTDGRGLPSNEFDEEDIVWDDDADAGADQDDDRGLSPIEAMVGDSMDVVVPDDEDDDDEDDDEVDEADRA